MLTSFEEEVISNNSSSSGYADSTDFPDPLFLRRPKLI